MSIFQGMSTSQGLFKFVCRLTHSLATKCCDYFVCVQLFYWYSSFTGKQSKETNTHEYTLSGVGQCAYSGLVFQLLCPGKPEALDRHALRHDVLQTHLSTR